jgi:protein required for attachment to host cells
LRDLPPGARDNAVREEKSEETLSRGMLRCAITFLPPRCSAEKYFPHPSQGHDQGRELHWNRHAPGSVQAAKMNKETTMPDFRLFHDIWVLVADGEKALFLRNEGDAVYPDLRVVREMHEDNPPTHEQGTDRPGRLGDEGSMHKSAVQDTDWHKIAKERFVGEIAERLYELAHRGRFERIVLVAPPIVLGELRRILHKEVAQRVVAEVPKTLTGHPVWEIEKVLRQGGS